MAEIKWKNCFRIGVSIFILFLCCTYWKTAAGFAGKVFAAAAPLLIGAVIAYVLNILMSFYERHYFVSKSDKKIIQKSRRPICMVAAFLSLILIFLLVIRLVIPELVSCVQLLVAEIPPAIEKVLASDWIHELFPKDFVEKYANIDWANLMEKAIQILRSGIGSATGAVVNAVSSVLSTVVTVFISIIFAIYMMSGRDDLQRQAKKLMKHYLPGKWDKRIGHWMSVLNDCFHRYIVGQCMEAVILGVLCIAGMLICRFPYAAMIGTLVGFTALIPVAGAYIGAGVGAVMILTKSPIQALLFLVFIVVLQQLEGNLIYPRVVGKSIGLPAIWVLAAVTIGGSLMGILGMLVGVPLAAALYRLISEDVNRVEMPLEGTIEDAKESLKIQKNRKTK